MESGNGQKRPAVPYIPFKTFTSFLANMKGKLPDQIDNSVLTNMSGTARSQLLSALKSLDLVTPEGTVKDSLRKLSDFYSTPQWQEVLGAFLRTAYSDVVGELNVATATPAMLRDRFKNLGGVDGGTVDNAIRFYINALKEAEIPYSPHLVVRQRAPRGSSSRRRTVAPKVGATREEEEGEDFDIPDGTFEISLAMLGVSGKLYLPEDLSPDQWSAISDFVKTVINLRQRAQGNE